MADERFFPVNVANKVYIQRNIKKQRKEKKNHSKVRVFTLTTAKINSVHHNELQRCVYDYFKQLVPHVRPNDINS